MVSEDDYKCRCPAGFGGKNCEVNVDDCAASPCQNGGTCFDFVNDYKCYCHAGFMGRNCEQNADDCRGDPCANGGTCHDAINDFVCTCRPGYTGKDCSEEINECFNNPCMNGAFCSDRLNDFECKCLPGYSGKHCNVLPDGTVQKVSAPLRLLLELFDRPSLFTSIYTKLVVPSFALFSYVSLCELGRPIWALCSCSTSQ